VQAVWRGYILRVRLEQALEFAKFEDEDDFDFQEVDLKDFNFDEVTPNSLFKDLNCF
jgi:hypothetical protein